MWSKAAFLALVLVLVAKAVSAGEPETMVILNGQSVPVFFNDGDSFRVLGGPMKGAKARLAGYNTLESHGAVHSWGTWTVKEMYVLAKMATLHARKGKWTCTSDGKTDTYGRMLTFCPGLRLELIRMGLAHAMNIDDEPSAPELLEAQREAIAAKRGIWAHGVPDFILTSLHSVEEDLSGKGTYNRLVSTKDGHSVKWKHTTRYRECENVCQIVYSVDESEIDFAKIKAEIVKFFGKADPDLAKNVKNLDEDSLHSLIVDFARYRHVNRTIPKEKRNALTQFMDSLAKNGVFGEQESMKGSCMVHVPFERRFGGTRAECLKK